jgi:hypothetical protein
MPAPRRELTPECRIVAQLLKARDFDHRQRHRIRPDSLERAFTVQMKN